MDKGAKNLGVEVYNNIYYVCMCVYFIHNARPDDNVIGITGMNKVALTV